MSTMTCSIIWMALCKLGLRRWHNGRKTYNSPSRLRARSGSNIMLNSLQRLASSSFQHLSLIRAGSCHHFASGTRSWIVILRTRLLVLPNTRRPFWSMWRMNTMPNITQCPSFNPKMSRLAISSPLQTLLDLVNHLWIHMIFPAMVQNT